MHGKTLFPDRIWNLECCFLWREENRRTVGAKTRTNNKLNPRITPGRKQTRATLVGGERFQHCAIPVPQNLQIILNHFRLIIEYSKINFTEIVQLDLMQIAHRLFQKKTSQAPVVCLPYFNFILRSFLNMTFCRVHAFSKFVWSFLQYF